jgi:signal transduction histidine kinase
MPKAHEGTKTQVEPRGSMQHGAAMFRELADSLPHALWISESGTLCYVNPACRLLTGLPLAPQDAAAKLYDAVHPQDRQTFLDHLVRTDNADFECRVLHADGSVAWVRARMFPVAGSLLAGIMEEVTASRSAIEKSERRINDFVSTVSHELRTPLTSISGSLGLLAGNASGRLPAAAECLFAIAYANRRRLVRLVSDILDVEKIESGTITFDVKRVNINVLVEQAVEGNRGFAETFGVRIRLAVGANDCNVEVDPDRLVQVVTNLLSNAVKFSPPDGDVEVGVEPQGANVIISVRDHGAGVPENFKPRMFEKFARAETSGPRRNEGSGLGLSITKGIVTRLGGALRFADAPGGGTLFQVELPVSGPPAVLKLGPAGRKDVA